MAALDSQFIAIPVTSNNGRAYDCRNHLCGGKDPCFLPPIPVIKCCTFRYPSPEEPMDVELSQRTIAYEPLQVHPTIFRNRIPIDPPAELRTVVSVARSDTCTHCAHATPCAPLLPRPRRGLRSQVVAHDSGMVDLPGGAVKPESAFSRLTPHAAQGTIPSGRLAIAEILRRFRCRASCNYVRAIDISST